MIMATTIVNFEMRCSSCLRTLRGEYKVNPNFKTHKDIECWFVDCKAQNEFKKEYIISWVPKK